MTKLERLIYEQEKTFAEEEQGMVYSITYYDDENEQYAKLCDDFEEVIDFACKLIGWRHIDILRFSKSEL